jgi:hypothetical protein
MRVEIIAECGVIAPAHKWPTVITPVAKPKPAEEAIPTGLRAARDIN